VCITIIIADLRVSENNTNIGFLSNGVYIQCEEILNGYENFSKSKLGIFTKNQVGNWERENSVFSILNKNNQGRVK
jgi:hypothetical protein